MKIPKSDVPAGTKHETVAENILFRLYLARQALNDGRHAADDPLPFGRMKALTSLDDAAEWTTLALLQALNRPPKRNAALSEHLDVLVAKKPELGSHRTPLERLRRLRDRVKHDGVVPSQEDARQASVEVESFMRAAVRSALDQELDGLSPAALLPASVARIRLISAGSALERGDYNQTIVDAAVAFAVASHGLTDDLSPFYRGVTPSRDLIRRLFREIGRAAEQSAS